MKTIIKCTILFSILLLGIRCKQDTTIPHTAEPTPKERITVAGVKINTINVVGNLSLFMLTGKEGIPGNAYKTLSAAMAEKQVVVKETGSVNELSIDNNSDHYVFIHSGDIVKGGKQDRTISFDVIIPPQTKNIPLASFCVEQGRWQQRANEEVSSFESNTKMLSSRDLKLAAKHDKNQAKVWSKVAEQKEYLSDKLSARKGYAIDVSDNESQSSLQLTLESDALKQDTDSIHATLQKLIDIPNAIGYAYAINGEIYGVEVYNNQKLFNDLWDKVLESIIVEAISKEGEKTQEAKSEKDILEFMESVSTEDKQTNQKINSITNLKTTEGTEGNILFSTEDLNKQKWIHNSYMKIDTSAISVRKMAFSPSSIER